MVQILIADDDAMIRKLLSTILAALGCEIDQCQDGIEAIKMMNATNYDLIFMDRMMPLKDGLSCCKEYRLHEQSTHKVPIVAITGGDQHDINECLDAGMTDCVFKPFTRADIEAIIHRHLSHNNPHANKYFDKEIALELLDNDEEMFKDMVEMFIGLEPEIIHDFEVGISDKDCALLTSTAHTLKNRALYVGSQHLSDSSKDIETLCRNGKFSEAVPLTKELIPELTQLTKHLQSFI